MKIQIVVTLIIVFLFSCSEPTIEEQIIGNWKAKEIKITNFNEVLDAGAKMMGEASDEKKKILKEESKKTADFFKKEGKLVFYENKNVLAHDRKGRWEINKEKTLITLILEEEKFDFKINKISETELDLLLMYDMGNVIVKVKSVFVRDNKEE